MSTAPSNVAVIGIHGLGRKPPETCSAACWKAALADGLERNLGCTLDPLPFQLVYWGLWNYPDNDPDQDYEPGAGVGPYPNYADNWRDQVLAGALDAGGDMLDAGKRFLGLDAAGDEFLRAKLQDLAVYYDNPEKRELLRGLLRKALIDQIEGNARIMLVAHSMGTIVAYDVLRDIGRGNPRAVVDHFITLGSPLGLPHVLHKIAREWGRPRVPSIVGRWSNFAERRDPIAFDVRLGGDFGPSDKGVAVQDDLVINSYAGRRGPWRYHSAMGYLRAPEVSRTVRDFL